METDETENWNGKRKVEKLKQEMMHVYSAHARSVRPTVPRVRSRDGRRKLGE